MVYKLITDKNEYLLHLFVCKPHEQKIHNFPRNWTMIIDGVSLSLVNIFIFF